GRAGRCRDDRDVMPALVKEPCDLGGVAGGTADVRRPDPRDDENPHAVAGTVGPRPGRRCSRTTTQIQMPANTTLAASVAPAAPVACHRWPMTTISGTRNAVSIAYAMIRSPGRPIETGSDLCHAITK